MNNILLLTDFSEASRHAGRYAALLSQQLRSERLILFHAYLAIMPLPVSEIPTPALGLNDPLAFTQNIEETRRRSLLELKTLYDELRKLAYEGTTIEYRTEEASLVASINDIVQEMEADLVIIASTGAGLLERTLTGDDTMHIADESKYPVLLVPPQAPLELVRRIVFACDLKKTEETTPVNRLRKLLDDFQAELLIVNVDHEEKHVGTQTFENAVVLGKWLADYNPAYEYIKDTDLVRGITTFAQERKASLIIAIHKKHGFFGGLFHRSATHQLAHHVTIPLLVMGEEEE